MAITSIEINNLKDKIEIMINAIYSTIRVMNKFPAMPDVGFSDMLATFNQALEDLQNSSVTEENYELIHSKSNNYQQLLHPLMDQIIDIHKIINKGDVPELVVVPAVKKRLRFSGVNDIKTFAVSDAPKTINRSPLDTCPTRNAKR